MAPAAIAAAHSHLSVITISRAASTPSGQRQAQADPKSPPESADDGMTAASATKTAMIQIAEDQQDAMKDDLASGDAPCLT